MFLIEVKCVLSTDMAKADLENYNDFGRWIHREKRDLSVAQVAKRAGLSPTKLGRIMRRKPFKSPDLATMEAIAKGLGRSTGTIQGAVMDAIGGAQVGELTGAQRTIVDVTADLSEDWQQVIVEIVLRLTDQLARRE